jgi:hypothetical protein
VYVFTTRHFNKRFYTFDSVCTGHFQIPSLSTLIIGAVAPERKHFCFILLNFLQILVDKINIVGG